MTSPRDPGLLVSLGVANLKMEPNPGSHGADAEARARLEAAVRAFEGARLASPGNASATMNVGVTRAFLARHSRGLACREWPLASAD